MEWRKCYLDLILVPSSLLLSVGYHLWLWRRVRSTPLRTIIGVNSAGRRLWILAMLKDNDKKNILAVQSLRNAIMGSTLMATTSILLCSGLAAVISSTYSVKKPVGDSVYGAHGEFMVALKYVTLLVVFLFAFLCYSLSIRFLNQLNFLINIPILIGGGRPELDRPAAPVVDEPAAAAAAASMITVDYLTDILERGFLLNTIGNRLFYAALPLLLWIFGPVLVFLSSVTLVPILYNLDALAAPRDCREGKGGGRGVVVKVEGMMDRDCSCLAAVV